MTMNVLILCTHNSARSVLGVGMLNHWAKKLGKDVRALETMSQARGIRTDATGHWVSHAQVLQLPLNSLNDTDLQRALSGISAT